MTKQEFWSSFEHHMPALERLLSGETTDYTAYNALSADLHAFNEYLVPEITGSKDSGFTLIISCDDFRQGSPAVEELTKDISVIQNWTIKKYRQPGAMEFIPVNGRKVFRKDILLTWEKLPNQQYTLTFYFKWYQHNQTHKTGAILHLDHTIGEYAAMTNIRGVEFKSLPLFGSKSDLKNLDDLKAQMELSY
jgi:hypothetical protein